ncbi:MAG: hypothetical protein RRA94_16450, partial [Bacteroidota bacterium]|nr:hypothetical protein [Bacteroidota bacterium]
MSDDALIRTHDRDSAARFRTILEQAGELARLLLKSPQAPRALTSQFLHGRKRFTSAERAEISAAAFHALRCWRPATFLLTGETGEVSTRVDLAQARASCAAAVLLSLAAAESYPLPAELTAARSREALAHGSALLLDDFHPSWRSAEAFGAEAFGAEAMSRLAALPAVAASLPDWVL